MRMRNEYKLQRKSLGILLPLLVISQGFLILSDISMGVSNVSGSCVWMSVGTWVVISWHNGECIWLMFGWNSRSWVISVDWNSQLERGYRYDFVTLFGWHCCMCCPTAYAGCIPWPIQHGWGSGHHLWWASKWVLEWNLKGCLAIDREGSHNGIPQLCAFFSITNFIVIDEILPLLWYPEQVTKPWLKHSCLFTFGTQCFYPHPDVDIYQWVLKLPSIPL